MIKCKNKCPLGKFDGCCHECFDRLTDCPDKCEYTPQECEDAIIEGDALQVFQTKAAAVIKAISDLAKANEQIQAQVDEMRKQLKLAMEEHGITKFDNDVIKVTYVAATTRTSVDSTKLKAQMPDVWEKFSKTSNVSAFVKVELKGGDKK